MRIYYYDPNTGIYQGEDFADERFRGRGVFIIPPYATSIAPPDCNPGQAPFYNAKIKKWELRALPRRESTTEPSIRPVNASR